MDRSFPRQEGILRMTGIRRQVGVISDGPARIDVPN